MSHRHGIALPLCIVCLLLAAGCASYGDPKDLTPCNGMPTTVDLSCGDLKYVLTYCCRQAPTWTCENGVLRIVRYDGWLVIEGVDPTIATQHVIVTGLPSRDQIATRPTRSAMRLLVARLPSGIDIGYAEAGVQVSMKGKGLIYHARQCADPGKPLGYKPGPLNLWNGWCDPDDSSLPSLEHAKDNAAQIEAWIGAANAKCGPHKPPTQPCPNEKH
jgi:hypothetical protein